MSRKFGHYSVFSFRGSRPPKDTKGAAPLSLEIASVAETRLHVDRSIELVRLYQVILWD